jgi:hypothetical protein
MHANTLCSRKAKSGPRVKRKASSAVRARAREAKMGQPFSVTNAIAA